VEVEEKDADGRVKTSDRSVRSILEGDYGPVEKGLGIA
jgi:hypothetical protein